MWEKQIQAQYHSVWVQEVFIDMLDTSGLLSMESSGLTQFKPFLFAGWVCAILNILLWAAAFPGEAADLISMPIMCVNSEASLPHSGRS